MEALGRAPGVKGRIEVTPTPGTGLTVLIDYAHTPDGLENILRSARRFARGRVIAVFGCGGDRDRLKRPVMGASAWIWRILWCSRPTTQVGAAMSIILEVLSGAADSRTPWVAVEDRGGPSGTPWTTGGRATS